MAYALKYPTHLTKLILVSPVGIPCSQYAIDHSAFPEDEMHPNMQPRGSCSFAPTRPRRTRSILGAPSSKHTIPKHCYRNVPRWLRLLWRVNISPFTLIRSSGPFGPMLASAWTSAMTAALSSTEAHCLQQYLYSIFRQHGSGEYAPIQLLGPGPFAKLPLHSRIPQVILSRMVPVTMIYGANDWVDIKVGERLSRSVLTALVKSGRGSGGSEDSRRSRCGSPCFLGVFQRV